MPTSGALVSDTYGPPADPPTAFFGRKALAELPDAVRKDARESIYAEGQPTANDVPIQYPLTEWAAAHVQEKQVNT